MNFLKTFFGQILRKSDVDFQNSGARKTNVQTHIDYTRSNGGVTSGLDVYKSVDGLSILVTPGVFYSKGGFIDSNSQGGGERCQIYTTQKISGFPATAPLNGNPTFLAVYAKPINQNNNPDPGQSQVVVTSKNIQTGENIPVRQYTAGIVTITAPILAGQISSINGVVLALVQIDYVGTTRVSSSLSVQAIDTSVKQDYLIAGLIDVPKQKLSSLAIADNFIESRMIGDDQVIARNLADGLVTSPKLAVWDGITSGTTSGSGVATDHIKNDAVTSAKLSPTGSLDGFSQLNYVFNGSFDIVPNTSVEPELVGWTVFNQISGNVAYSGAPAGIFKTNTESVFGHNSAVMIGADPTKVPGAVVQGLALSQDINFNNERLNDKDVMAFFYMKTDNAIPTAIPGITGVTASIQFLSSGTAIGDPTTIVNYSGGILDWTRFQTNSPVQFADSSTTADGIRFTVSGNLTNSTSVFLDNFYVGLTNLLPSWSPSQADSDYADTLTKANIHTTNLTASNVIAANVSAVNYSSVSSGTSNVGSINNPFNSINADNIYLDGTKLSVDSKKFISFTGVGNNLWTVPNLTEFITVEAFGAGGGGAGGCDDSSFAFIASERAKGGAGGSAGEYVKKVIAVTPGEVLTITVGTGGGGGIGGTFNDPNTSYMGASGQSTVIKRSDGTILATAFGGGGGGIPGVNGVRNPTPGGGITFYGNNFISIKGDTAIFGNQIGPSPFQSTLVSNCGGPGAFISIGYFKSSGGAGGAGYDAGGSTPFNPAQLGQPGSQPGAGGGGGGGSLSGVAGPPPLDSRGGSGGKGGPGLVIIHF